MKADPISEGPFAAALHHSDAAAVRTTEFGSQRGEVALVMGLQGVGAGDGVIEGLWLVFVGAVKCGWINNGLGVEAAIKCPLGQVI